MKSTLNQALTSLLLATPLMAVSDLESDTLQSAWTPDLDAPGVFSRSAAGDFDGDGRPDVLLLDNYKAVVLHRPGGGMAPSELPLWARSLDVLPGASPLGRDAVVLSDGAGLHLCWYSGSGFSTSQLAAGPWAGAALVRAADIDGDGTLDVVGLSADRGTLLLMRRVAGTAATFLATQTLPLGHAARDVAALRYTGSADSQFALLSDWGLEIVRGTGEVLYSAASILPGGAIAVLREGPADRLVWIQDHAAGGQQWLLVLSFAGTEQLLGLGALDVVAAAAGDVDGDGDSDLVLSHRSDHTLLWLENLRSPAHPACARFSLAEGATFRRVGPETSAPENQAWPALADMDGDGDLDALFGVQSTREILVVRGQGRDHASTSLQHVAAQVSFSSVPGESRLILDLEATASTLSGSHVEILLWRQQTIGGLVQPAPLHHERFAWNGSALQIVVPIPEASEVFGGVYSVEIRRVDLAEGRVLPSLHLAYVADQAAADELLAQSPDAEIAGSVLNSTGTNGGVVVRRPHTGTWGRNMPPQSPPQPATGG